MKVTSAIVILLDELFSVRRRDFAVAVDAYGEHKPRVCSASRLRIEVKKALFAQSGHRLVGE